MKVIVIGGGWAGCAAAITAKKAGADVTLYEKTDMLLGLGNVGGIMRNNGRYTASEELIALGAPELINISDNISRHKNIDFPGHKHARLTVLRHFYIKWFLGDYFFLAPQRDITTSLVLPSTVILSTALSMR
jgi:flavin-dependent dehydrogenase